MKIIINADDFGLTFGQNRGIIEAYQQGVVTSTTLMMNAQATDDAIALSKENPGLGLGLHFVMDVYQPISDPSLVKSLVDNQGNFKKFDLSKSLDIDANEVELELLAQLKKALDQGLNIDHLDSHHHIHLHPEVFEAFLKVAKRYDLPIRFDFESHQPFYLDLLANYKVAYVYGFFDFYKDDLVPEYFKDLEKKAQGQEFLEIMCHPAHVDEMLKQVSSYNEPRAQELKTLIDPQTRIYLENHQLMTYGQLNKGEKTVKTIILLCSAGMSTSLLVTRMIKAAEEQNYECHIEAYGTTMAQEAAKVADVILLGPQVRFELEKIRKQVSQPVDVINMRDYGTVNGAAVLAHARRLLGDE